MKKAVYKGCEGYLTHRKKKMGVITGICFLIVFSIFIAGIIIYGSRNNIMTVMAVVCVLPSSKFAVDLMMILPYKSASRDLVDNINATDDKFLHKFDCVFTTKNQSFYAPAVIISDGLVFLLSYKKYAKADEFKEALEKFVMAGGYKIKVEILDDEKQFIKKLERMSQSKNVEYSDKELERLNKIWGSISCMCM